jgi:hypothetical protein
MKDGHIQGTYSRHQLYHRASFTADLLDINKAARCGKGIQQFHWL